MNAPRLPLLEFDGDCGICTRLAQWVEVRLPPSAGVSVEPWQRLDLDETGLTLADVRSQAWWIDPGGTRLAGHRAVAAALTAIGGGWRLVGRALGVPPISWLAAATYRVVARNRHRLARFGTTPACADGGCDGASRQSRGVA